MNSTDTLKRTDLFYSFPCKRTAMNIVKKAVMKEKLQHRVIEFVPLEEVKIETKKMEARGWTLSKNVNQKGKRKLRFIK